jgi:hypothetical protein
MLAFALVLLSLLPIAMGYLAAQLIGSAPRDDHRPGDTPPGGGEPVPTTPGPVSGPRRYRTRPARSPRPARVDRGAATRRRLPAMPK